MVPYVAGGFAGQRTEAAVMMAKGGKDKVKTGKVAENREARFQYEVLDTYEVGMKLVGTEVKSCRNGKITIKDAFARVEKNGTFRLHNCHIAQHGETGQYFNHEEMRPRILLAHKEEIKKIDKSCQTKGHTVVPLKVYFNDNGFLKCEVGVCRGKNLANKKEAIKGRDQARDAKRELKSMGY